MLSDVEATVPRQQPHPAVPRELAIEPVALRLVRLRRERKIRERRARILEVLENRQTDHGARAPIPKHHVVDHRLTGRGIAG